MTQLVELQAALPKFRAAGIAVYAISYDDPAALADFAKHHGVTFPLLADPDSAVIDQFGIRNHFVTKDQVPYYGIPFPGTYLVDERGVVTAKFFERNIAQRATAERMIDVATGAIQLGDDAPQAVSHADEVRLTAAYHGGGGQIRSGATRQLVVRFDLDPGVHIYADPVPEGMVATSIRVTGPAGLHVGTFRGPPSHRLSMPGLDEELHVWSDRADFVADVYVDDRISSLVASNRPGEITLDVHVEYQACGDETCHIPKRERLTLEVPVVAHLGNALAGTLAGATTTTMNSRKFMRRLLWRGLLRSPLAGLRSLLRLWWELRKGPAGT